MTINSCDSTAILNLIINNSNTNNESIAACESFDWNGVTYTESGTYTYVNTNEFGCEQINILDLTIHQTTYGIDQQLHCDEYTWINGITYTENNNIETFTLTNFNGCDSVVTLNLTINNTDSTFSNVTSCDEFIWDGDSYTESGIYTNLYENALGCDSTHTLNLTINNTDSTFSNVTSCDEFIWDGDSYTESGIYTNLYQNTLGCDSTIH